MHIKNLFDGEQAVLYSYICGTRVQSLPTLHVLQLTSDKYISFFIQSHVLFINRYSRRLYEVCVLSDVIHFMRCYKNTPRSDGHAR